MESISWPVAAIVISFVLRKELGNLLSKIKKIRHNETEVEFKEEIEVAKKEASKSLPESKPTKIERSRSVQLAELSPRGAIIEAWLNVEAALKEYAKRHGAQIDENKPFTIRALHFHSLDYNNVGKGVLNMLERLRRLRNDAVHLTDSEIETESAVEYIELANRVIYRIEEA
ncbi:MAG: hypothetical protein OQK82_00055 [Candidatus Pacearchaeota archaeon]|nr:hypothetical protein [Candidatus Pacearchaeota archaeon]